MHTLTDNALMLKVKSGELDTLGLLYERYKRRLFGFFYNLHRDATLSEDLVQNVFVRVLKYKHTFTGEGSFAAWIFCMARNINSDYWKRQKKVTYELSAMEFKLQGPTDLEADMVLKDGVMQLHQALGQLPPDKREILVLSKLKEMKFSEIAQIMGCSESAAKVKAHRALKELRKVYMDIENGNGY